MEQAFLCGVTGRTFEFEAAVLGEDGSEYELQDGDRLFFLVDRQYRNEPPLLSLIQPDTHFKVKRLELPPNQYDFEFGILFANGDAYSIIARKFGKLKVYGNAGEIDADAQGQT